MKTYRNIFFSNNAHQYNQVVDQIIFAKLLDDDYYISPFLKLKVEDYEKL